jgi:hypothetical protein
MYSVVPFRFPHLESPFNPHPFRHVTIPFFINGRSHHRMQSGFTRALFLQVSIINCDRIQSHIYFTIFSHFIHSYLTFFFFDRSNCPYLIVRRPFTLTVRRLCVQSVTLILYLCIVSRSGSAAPHHTFFLNASIYDVSSFLPLPPHQQFPYNVYMYQRYFSPFTYSCTSCSYTVCNTVL